MSEKKEICLKNEEEFFRILKEVKKESRLQETDQYLQHGVTSVYRHSLARGLFQLLSGREDAPESPDQRDDPGSPSSRLFSL